MTTPMPTTSPDGENTNRCHAALGPEPDDRCEGWRDHRGNHQNPLGVVFSAARDGSGLAVVLYRQCGRCPRMNGACPPHHFDRRIDA